MRKLKRGPLPKFSEYHHILLLYIISEEIIGRQALSTRLEIGEGTIRTLIKKLIKIGVIKTSKKGCDLTDKGRKILSNLKDKIQYKPYVEAGTITLGIANASVLVRKSSEKVKSGLEQRDAAIITGAMGASTIIYTKNGPFMPGVKVDKSTSARILVLSEDMSMEIGDVLIIGTGEFKGEAEQAAWAAAYTLLDYDTIGECSIEEKETWIALLTGEI